MPAPVRYRIFPINPAAHLFEVRCTVADPDPAGQAFSLPAWIPGSYMIREFARNIVTLTAECAGAAVPVEKLDKHSWRCAPCAGLLTVTCEVYAWDLSVRAAHLDTTHGYFNGASVFLMAHGRERRPCEVEILPPEGVRDWRLATALPALDAPAFGFGRYRAADYDELIDHPVEMGSFTHAQFSACGVPHDVVLTGRQRADLDRLCRDMQAICEHHITFFGEPAPMARYVFLIMVVGEGYGGLEHRASTSLLVSRKSLPRPGEAAVNDDYRAFLGLVSHEYFHTWNVKRIKPKAFLPYDLSREAYTRQLWAFEGITSYYDDLALVRSQRIEPQDYLQALGETATRVWRGSGRFKQTVTESSFDAWTKFYRQDENAPNAIVSYYTKGALVALALDLTLRCGTGGRRSLDDVMRALWERHGRTPTGVEEGGIERLAAEVSGLDLREFFDRALRSTEDLPLAGLLGDVGVEFVVRPAESAADKGGKPPKKSAAELMRRAVLGVKLTVGAEAKLAQVFDGAAAQAAGLAAGDALVAVDGLRVTKANLDALLATHWPGERVTVHAFRRDELMTFVVELQAPPMDTCEFRFMPDADGAPRAHRVAWLGS